VQKEDAEKELVREIRLQPVILTINPEDDVSSFSDSDDDEYSRDL